MKQYRVVTEGFQIGSTVYKKNDVIPLPEVAGEYGIRTGYLKPARRSKKKPNAAGEYERRDMEAKSRNGRYDEAVVVVTATESTEDAAE